MTPEALDQATLKGEYCADCGTLLKDDYFRCPACKRFFCLPLSHVNVDTTVQEKNITHPTNSELLLLAIEKLAAAAKDRGLPLRQSYVRVSASCHPEPAY